MLHIILMILKILGILILSILGLGLCIGLLVLLCPIRYYLEGSIYGKPEGKIRISWLLRLVCATISYKENRAECKICILGIRLKKRRKEDSDNTDLKKEKKKFSFLKKWRKNPITGKKKKEKEDKQAERIEEELEAKEVQQTEEDKKEEIKTQQTQAEKEEIKEQQIQIKKEEIKVQQAQTDKEEQTDKREKVQQEEIKIEQNIQEETVENKQPLLEKVIIKIREILEKVKRILTKIEGILGKIKGIPVKIKNIPAKIHGILSAVRANIQKFLELLRNLNKKKQTILAFIKDEKNKEAFRHTKGRLFQILFHVLPGKVTLKLHYGFEDPATTGMLTGMIFMFYPRSAERFQLTPDFEKRVLEGELTLKGRVQLIRVLWNLFSIYSHKECNRIIKMMLKKLKTR